MKEKHEKKVKSQKQKLLIGILIAVTVLVIAVTVIICLWLLRDDDASREGMMNGDFSAQVLDGAVVYAYGSTNIGTTEGTFPITNLENALEIEEVYVSSGDQIEEGKALLKFTEESLEAVREELEDEVRTADLEYRAGVIEYEQNKISYYYDKEATLLEGKYAEEVYAENTSGLYDSVESAKEALEEAQAQIAEYETALASNSYYEDYQVAYYKQVYDENLALLQTKMAEWGVSWSEITGGGFGSSMNSTGSSMNSTGSSSGSSSGSDSSMDDFENMGDLPESGITLMTLSAEDETEVLLTAASEEQTDTGVSSVSSGDSSTESSTGESDSAETDSTGNDSTGSDGTDGSADSSVSGGDSTESGSDNSSTDEGSSGDGSTDTGSAGSSTGSTDSTGSSTGSTSSAVTDSALHSQYVKVLSSFYDVLEDNLEDYNQALEDYEEAVADTSFNLQTLKLELSSLEKAYAQAQENYESSLLSAKLTKETSLSNAEKAENNYEANMEMAEAEFEKLKSAKEEADENLELFETLIRDGCLYASESGEILRANLRAGSRVTSDSMLYTLRNAEELTVTVSISQTDIASVQVGDSAIVQSENNGIYNGEITAINPISGSESKTSVTYSVTVKLDNTTQDLDANETVVVYFGMNMGE